MRPQIARAHRRSLQLHLMPLLMARLERQLMRGIWAAVDRPNPTNCRRTVAKRAPHQTASLTGYLKRAPIGPKSLPFCYFEWNYRCLEGRVLPSTHRSMASRPWCRLNNRIGPRLERFTIELRGFILPRSVRKSCWTHTHTFSSQGVSGKLRWDMSRVRIGCLY